MSLLSFHHFFAMDEAPNNHRYTDDDERDAEPLAHVEDHVALKVDLYVFQELDADARAEDDDKESAKHQTRLFDTEVALIVHPQQDTHRHKAEESLI